MLSNRVRPSGAPPRPGATGAHPCRDIQNSETIGAEKGKKIPSDRIADESRNALKMAFNDRNMENENLCAKAKSTSKASIIELCSVEHGNTWAESSRKSSVALAAHNW
jgi:hypothetical protein